MAHDGPCFLGHGLDVFGFRHRQMPILRKRKLHLGMGMPKCLAYECGVARVSLLSNWVVGCCRELH